MEANTKPQQTQIPNQTMEANIKPQQNNGSKHNFPTKQWEQQ